MLDYYQTAKEREHKRRKVKHVAIAAAIFFVVLIGGGVFFLRSNALGIKGVTVSVQDEGLNDAIKQIFFSRIGSRSFLSRVAISGNSIVLAEIDREEVAEEIQSQIPILKDASVDVNLFSRTVLITASLRERYGLWCQKSTGNVYAGFQEASSSDESANAGGCFWFDRDGFVFSKGPSAEGQLIRKVIDTDPAGNPLHLGGEVLKSEQMRALLSVFDFVDKVHLSQTVLFLSDRALEEVSTDNSNPPIFYFSLRNDPAYALAAVEDMRSKVSKLQYIDLRVPNRIYYK